MGSQLQRCKEKSYSNMISKSFVLILVVACVGVQSRSPISGLLKELIEEVKAEEAIAHPFGAKTEVAYKYKNKNREVGDCDPANDCGDSGCCSQPVDDCDADTLFVCCEPCTGVICASAEWACDANSDISCKNRVRFLETILTDGHGKTRSHIKKIVGKEVKAEVQAVKTGHIAQPLGAKNEVVYKGNIVDDCDPANDCGDRGCCPYPVDDCSQDRLFICCDPCTGNTCGTSEWACEQETKNSVACQNRMRFLKTIVIENPPAPMPGQSCCPGTESFMDPLCNDPPTDPYGGLGCNACGIQECRICGGDVYISCP